jgi:D-alanyl-D-alanine carboxypeptidase (penicillin-binding protein 5/6)
MARQAGSTMFLSPNETVKVDDLLHGIVTLSGNDACVVLAEGMLGSEEAFVARMNEEAEADRPHQLALWHVERLAR